MERNANFDYRNYFFPGPAFPVQIYPMSGNPRYPFSPTFGTATMNDLASHVFPGFTGENITEEVGKSDLQGRRGSSKVSELSSPSHTLVKTRDAVVSLPPLQVDEALQGLSRQLSKAMAFCERCLDKHNQIVRDINSHAKKDARNSLWKGLLESRFDASDSDKDLFHNLPGRIEYCTQQIREAASADPSARSTSHDKRREFERLVLKVKQIGVMCDKIVGLSKKALSDRQACEAMVDEMKTLKAMCKVDIGSLEKNDEEEDDNFQDDGDTAETRGW
ncbi:hypothetical protein VM1G_06127 [Cytospora mali]|uniref:Uncharacterized protein n=1 Tax=Cytospora mali TaxID=578113 RepID=A0A194W3M4_CYTMA|nr:hypothetical protein VM1G_06127 [Valsa mali]